MKGLSYILLLVALQVSTAAYSQTRDTAYVCDGGIVNYNGRNYTAGTYTVRQQGQADIILSVINASRYTLTQKDTIYRGESFIYKGHRRSFNSAGTFTWTDSLLSVHGCDSVVNHTLTVKARPTTYAEFETHICKGDSVEVAGRWYKTNGSNSVTIRGGNYLKGDSIVTFRVYVHSAVEKVYYATIKQGEAKQWYFHRCSTLPAGTHRLTSANLLHTIYGCDSIEVMYLTVLPRTYGTDTLHLCQNNDGTYNGSYNGKTYTKATEDRHTLTNRAGGDSILTLTVMTHPRYTTRIDTTIYYGQTFTIADTTYKDLLPGEYDIKRTTTSIYGCDITIDARLTVSKARQTISFTTALPDTLYLRQRIPAEAQASSGLPVTYEIDNTQNLEWSAENELRAIAPGYATLTVTQSGNELYLPADKKEKQFVIVSSTDLTAPIAIPTPIKTIKNGRVIIIVNNKKYDLLGRTVEQ